MVWMQAKYVQKQMQDNVLVCEEQVSLPGCSNQWQPHESSQDGTFQNKTDPSSHSNRRTFTDIQGVVATMVEEVLGYEVEGTEPLMSAGINSRRAMDLLDSLEEMLGVDVPGTALFNYPSVNGVVSGFHSLWCSEPSGREVFASLVLTCYIYGRRMWKAGLF